MARVLILLGIVGLIGLGTSGEAQADYRDNRVTSTRDHQRVVPKRKAVGDYKRGRTAHPSVNVPELDPSAAPLALALLLGGAALTAERRRGVRNRA
jgi:hypothetical protein